MRKHIGVVILAAGQSRRFGEEDKRLVKLPNGKRVIEQTIANCQGGGLPVRVVLREDDQQLAKICLKQGASIIIATDAELGMGHSIAAAMDEIKSWDGCLVVLADMPFVQSATYQQIAEALEAHAIVRPRYQGQPGQPNGFLQEYFSELQKSSGDSGAKHLLKSTAVHYLDVDDPGIHRDIDTPEQLSEWLQ
jgi:molybdenum cofactor cytidylyltransferase